MKSSVLLSNCVTASWKCLDSELWKHKMFSKAVYSKLEFSAPRSRKKISNFNSFFFFQNGFLAVPAYPAKLKKNSISFEWCKSGALLVPFVVSANKLTWQFTAPDADR